MYLQKYFRNLILIACILMLNQSCGTTSQLYRCNGINKMYTGQLTNFGFEGLQQYLTQITKSTLKDTIIIKYDYNHESCWDMLDQKDDTYIMNIVTKRKEKIQDVVRTRQNVSVFNFREPGNSFNKIKKWDNSIILDSSKYLLNLLFQKRYICGNSIIVMSDKRFVFMPSDPHFEALDFTHNQMVQILNSR